MKVAGCTFIRNAIKYDYPVVEAITSILPVCDVFIVNVGNSEDNTEQLIRSINDDKIQVLNSVWDESLRKGGRVLAVETDKAFDQVPADIDWCFYIQGDEVVHEKYLKPITEAMLKYKDDIQVEGLLFKYLHFYGSYDFVGDSRKWYSHEIRIIRNDKKIRAYRDAQGFRKDGRKLRVKLLDATIYHYGWVKNPYHQLEKAKNFYKLWTTEDSPPFTIPKLDEFQFDYSGIDSLSRFKDSHPLVMHRRINNINWKFDHDISKKNYNLKGYILNWIEKKTGKRLFDYRNYKLI